LAKLHLEDVMRSSPHRLATDDTSTAAEAVLVAGYRRMTAAQKLERVRQLTRAVQELALRDIQRRHPGASAREIQLRLASRWLKAETMPRVFGWDPEREGY
jgi:HAMP domain-containing protein